MGSCETKRRLLSPPVCIWQAGWERTTKKFISDIGIFGFEEVKDFVKAGRTGRRR